MICLFFDTMGGKENVVPRKGIYFVLGIDELTKSVKILSNIHSRLCFNGDVQDTVL